MIISEVIGAIDIIDSTLMEADSNVCLALANSYDKMLMIEENYSGDNMECFSIFQEGKIMDDVKEQGKGMSTIMKILSFIPRLIRSVFRALTGKLKQVGTQIKQSTENINKNTTKGQRISFFKKLGIGVAGTVVAGAGGAVIASKVKKKKNAEPKEDNNTTTTEETTSEKTKETKSSNTEIPSIPNEINDEPKKSNSQDQIVVSDAEVKSIKTEIQHAEESYKKISTNIDQQINEIYKGFKEKPKMSSSNNHVFTYDENTGILTMDINLDDMNYLIMNTVFPLFQMIDFLKLVIEYKNERLTKPLSYYRQVTAIFDENMRHSINDANLPNEIKSEIKSMNTKGNDISTTIENIQKNYNIIVKRQNKIDSMMKEITPDDIDELIRKLGTKSTIKEDLQKLQQIVNNNIRIIQEYQNTIVGLMNVYNHINSSAIKASSEQVKTLPDKMNDIVGEKKNTNRHEPYDPDEDDIYQLKKYGITLINTTWFRRVLELVKTHLYPHFNMNEVSKFMSKLEKTIKNLNEDDLEDDFSNTYDDIKKYIYGLDTKVKNADWYIVCEFLEKIGFKKIPVKPGDDIKIFATYFEHQIPSHDEGPRRGTIKIILQHPYMLKYVLAEDLPWDGGHNEVTLCGKATVYK